MEGKKEDGTIAGLGKHRYLVCTHVVHALLTHVLTSNVGSEKSANETDIFACEGGGKRRVPQNEVFPFS